MFSIIGYFYASNVNFELICIVVKIKSCYTHRVNLLRRVQLFPSWIGNQALVAVGVDRLYKKFVFIVSH